MTDTQLAGTVEGLAYALMALVADLEQRGLIDGDRYCQTLLARADDIRSRPEFHDCRELKSEALTLHELTAVLDGLRRSQQASAEESEA